MSPSRRGPSEGCEDGSHQRVGLTCVVLIRRVRFTGEVHVRKGTEHHLLQIAVRKLLWAVSYYDRVLSSHQRGDRDVDRRRVDLRSLGGGGSTPPSIDAVGAIWSLAISDWQSRQLQTVCEAQSMERLALLLMPYLRA